MNLVFHLIKNTTWHFGYTDSFYLEENWKLQRFPSFRFCPIPKIENSEILEISLLLQILTVVVTKVLKTTKNWTETKTESLQYVLRRKNEHFRDFRVLGFCPITKIENSEISEIFLPQISTLVVTQDLKTTKKWTEAKTERFWYDLEEKWKFLGFSNLWFKAGGLRRKYFWKL